MIAGPVLDPVSQDGTFYDRRILQGPRHEMSPGRLIPEIVAVVGGTAGVVVIRSRRPAPRSGLATDG